MNTNFDNIEYLKLGNVKQKRAYEIIMKTGIMNLLSHYDPILVGTIPIDIDVENSDLDIICYFREKKDFIDAVVDYFGKYKHFRIHEHQSQEIPSIVARFSADDFEIEIFGQNIPVKEQNAYRHMLIEYKLLKKLGENFRHQVIDLKRRGVKTEPAFAQLLGLNGDPYEELLGYENEPD